jgi:hypothetical protein
VIRIYSGWLGSGKTYSMVHDAWEDFRNSYRQIFTNMVGLKFPESVYSEDIQQFCDLGQGLMLFDEVHMWLSARYWHDVPRSALAALAQSRKMGLDLYCTTQDISRVDTVLREITAELVQCRKFGRFILQTVVDPVAKVVLRRRLVRFSSLVGSLYDTLEIIRPSLIQRGRIPQSEALTLLRARKARPEHTKQRHASVFDSLPDLYEWRGNARMLTDDAVAMREYLRERGRLRSEHWREQVTLEIARFRWLRHFGLKPDDVSEGCTPFNPFAAGWSPREVQDRMREEMPEQVATSGRRSRKS